MAPVGVDEDPLDGRWEGLVEAGLHMVGSRGLAIVLVQRRLYVPHGVLLDLGPCPLRNQGHMAAKERLQAGEVHGALAVQLPSEGANHRHHVVGLR